MELPTCNRRKIPVTEIIRKRAIVGVVEIFFAVMFSSLAKGYKREQPIDFWGNSKVPARRRSWKVVGENHCNINLLSDVSIALLQEQKEVLDNFDTALIHALHTIDAEHENCQAGQIR